MKNKFGKNSFIQSSHSLERLSGRPIVFFTTQLNSILYTATEIPDIKNLNNKLIIVENLENQDINQIYLNSQNINIAFFTDDINIFKTILTNNSIPSQINNLFFINQYNEIGVDIILSGIKYINSFAKLNFYEIILKYNIKTLISNITNIQNNINTLYLDYITNQKITEELQKLINYFKNISQIKLYNNLTLKTNGIFLLASFQLKTKSEFIFTNFQNIIINLLDLNLNSIIIDIKDITNITLYYLTSLNLQTTNQNYINLFIKYPPIYEFRQKHLFIAS